MGGIDVKRIWRGSRSRPKNRLWWNLTLQINGTRYPSEGFGTTTHGNVANSQERPPSLLPKHTPGGYDR